VEVEDEEEGVVVLVVPVDGRMVMVELVAPPFLMLFHPNNTETVVVRRSSSLEVGSRHSSVVSRNGSGRVS